MVRDGDFVALFNSIHRVMKAEKELKARGLPILLIPAPRALQTDCGLAIRYAATERAAVEDALAEGEVEPAELYVKSDEEYVRIR